MGIHRTPLLPRSYRLHKEAREYNIYCTARKFLNNNSLAGRWRSGRSSPGFEIAGRFKATECADLAAPGQPDSFLPRTTAFTDTLRRLPAPAFSQCKGFSQ